MATTPDVRVRLSAEGVQEVVNALKAIQAQSQKTAASAKQMGSGFTELEAGVQALRRGMSALSAAAAAIGGLGFLKGLNDATAQLGLASKQTGIAVDALSRLAFAARATGVATDSLYDSLSDFSEKMFDAAAGSGDGADALKAMGFSAEYVRENINNLPKILGDVADKFASYEDGAAKTALAVKLFGDAGKTLVPLLSQGSAGLREAAGEADRFGATINTAAVTEATRFNSELAKLTASTEAFARAGLGPIVAWLNTTIARFREAKQESTGFVSGFYNFVSALGGSLGLSNSLGNSNDLGKVEAQIARLESKLKAAGSVDPNGVLFTQLQLARKNRVALLKEQAAAASAATEPDKPKTKAPDITIGKDAERAAKAAQARASAIAAGNERELALLRARNALTDAEQRAQAEQGLLSLDSYYRRRLARIEAENANEIQVARDKIAAARALALPADATEADRLNKTAAIQAAQDQLAQVEIQNAQRVADAQRAKSQEIKALLDERSQLERQQLEATDQREAAAIQALDSEIQKYEELLRKLGETEDAIARLTGEQRAQGMGRIAFDAAQREGTQNLTGLDEQKSAVERDQSTGKLWSFEAEAKLLAIERQRIPVLEDMYAKLKAAAEAAQSPELLEQARQMSVAIEDAKAKTDEYGISMAQLKQAGFDAAQQGFATFLTDVTSGNKSLAASFQSLAGSVVQALQQMLAQMLAVKAMNAVMGMFGGGGGGASFGGFPASAYATGGYIAGPGTGTSDSIPAWLSNGEFVVRAAAVNAVGLDALHEINRRGRLPAPRVSAAHPGAVARYADGGLVGSLADATGGGSTQLSIGLDDGLILKKLSSPEGQRVLVEALGQNRRALRQIIG